MSPLDPTSDEISELSDDQLKALVVRLCEAELLSSNQPLAGLVSGGDQNAPDGGLDLKIFGEYAPTAYLPCFPLGIQVKAEGMPRSSIMKEMRKASRPRPIFAELGRQQGGYIIVSSGDNCSVGMLEQRIEAMRAALHDSPDNKTLLTDFYDADRLARWASAHAGVAAWVSSLVGRKATGWQGFAPWSTPFLEKSPPLLVDEDARVYSYAANHTISVPTALDTIRTRLGTPKQAVRLVGLSGMGKTRFAQALFEEGKEAHSVLSPSLAVYGDAGSSPETLATTVAEGLAQRNIRAVLIVDNCPSELHRTLVDITTRPASKISLLTIDFDVQEEILPFTSIFRINPADEYLIDRLLSQRAPHLNWHDRSRVSEFSGGNARIALALARTSDDGGLAGLKDEQLLDRLFLTERRTPDAALRRVARTAALVYAFEVSTQEDQGEEEILASLSGVDADTFFEKTIDLIERGLAQQRGRQRAILPQAIAIRLAEEALRKTPEHRIWSSLAESAPHRLRRSFARRLSALEDHPVGRKLAGALFSQSEQLGFGNLENEDGAALLEYMAPIVPDAAFEKIRTEIERTKTAGESVGYLVRDRFRRILVALASKPDRFDAVVPVLAEMISNSGREALSDNNRRAFLTLFQVASSGTDAPPPVRFKMIETLAKCTDQNTRALAAEALDVALDVQVRREGNPVVFGNKTLGSGWKPNGREDLRAWYALAISTSARLAKSNPDFEGKFADRLEGLLGVQDLEDIGESALREYCGSEFWPRGWFAVCRHLNSLIRAKRVPSPRISDLEQKLRPRTLDDRYHAWLRGVPEKWANPHRLPRDNWRDYFSHTVLFGKQLADHPQDRAIILERALLDTKAHGFGLGEGLASSNDIEGVWNEIKSCLERAELDNWNTTVVQGYFATVAKFAPEKADSWLSQAMAIESTKWDIIPLSLAFGPIGEKHLRDCIELLNQGELRSRAFQHLRSANALLNIRDDTFKHLVESLANRPDGVPTALDLLGQRMRDLRDQPNLKLLINTGIRLLRCVTLHNNETIADDHQVFGVARYCLGQPDADEAANHLTRQILQRNLQYDYIAREHSLINLIIGHYPVETLDLIFSDTTCNSFDRKWLLGGHDSDDGDNARPISSIPDDVLLRWVAIRPRIRAVALAHHVSYFERDGEVFKWTSIARSLMEISGVERRVLAVLERRFHSGSWSGKSSGRYTRRKALVDALIDHPNRKISTWANATRPNILRWIEAMDRRDREASERFE